MTESKMPLRCLREQQPKKHANFDVSELIDSILEAKRAGPWHREIGVYHPSAIHGCKRALYYDRIGIDPKQITAYSMEQLMEVGTHIHHMVQEWLSEHEGFEPEIKARFKELHISGSTDGVFRKEDWVLEIKSMGNASFNSLTKPKPEHIWQVHIYMWCFDIPRAQLMYINRDNGKRRLFKVRFTNTIWDQIAEVISYVEECVEKNEPPPHEASKYTCNMCKFKSICKPPL